MLQFSSKLRFLCMILDTLYELTLSDRFIALESKDDFASMFVTLNSVTLLSSKNDILNVRVEDQILSSIIRDCQGNGHNPK